MQDQVQRPPPSSLRKPNWIDKQWDNVPGGELFTKPDSQSEPIPTLGAQGPAESFVCTQVSR